MTVELSPKGHPEIAAYGIEYSWGLQKRRYRKFWSIRAAGQRTHHAFLSLLDEVLDQEKTITKTRVRVMARKA